MSTNISINKIKCAVFDLDGTLLNTIKTINYYLNFALEKNSLGTVPEEKCRDFVGDGAVKLISRALDYLNCRQDDVFEKVFADYNEAYNSDPYYLTEIYEGIENLLQQLKERGAILAVLSNKPDFATRAAVAYFFPDAFNAAYGAREGIALKPNPEALWSLLNELGVSPDEVAYIGDSEPDVLTAKNAKVALPISVTWGFRTEEQLRAAGALELINHPQEILQLIQPDAK